MVLDGNRILHFLFSSDYRCIWFSTLSDTALLALVAQSLDFAPLVTAACLDTFLVAMTLAGIKGKLPTLLVPNIFIKFILMMFLLFMGCITIDNINKERELRLKETRLGVVILGHPSLPFWLILFTILETIQIRLCFSTWYRLVFATNQSRANSICEQGPVEKREPPSYATCTAFTVDDEQPCGSKQDELPSYEEALKREKKNKKKEERRVEVEVERTAERDRHRF